MDLTNKRREFYCAPSTATIPIVHTSSQEVTVQGIKQGFFVTDIKVVCYDANGLIPDDIITREQILIDFSQANGTNKWFLQPIDSIVLNQLNKNGQFKGFFLPIDSTLKWTAQHTSIVTATILVAPITIQLSLIGYKLYDN